MTCENVKTITEEIQHALVAANIDEKIEKAVQEER